MIKNEEDIILLIENDKWMMDILATVKLLNLPDWWICAGFVRSKIWDVLHNFSRKTSLPDVDVVYYDASNSSERKEKELEKKLKQVNPTIPWSVKNQARMHLVNNVTPYESSVDAISKFPETATALGVKLNENDKVVLIAPCGIHDVINLEIEPTPYFKECALRMKVFKKRVKKKNWQSTWYKLHKKTI